MTVENAKQFPKRYFAKHMVQGVASYEDERLMLDNAAINKMNPSFGGKPFYVNHQPVDLEKLHEADGYVIKSFYNEADGWHWAEILITSDAGHDAVKKGWRVSNAYIPTEFEGPGQYIALDYDRKIKNGEFTHLAGVPYPRYEDSIILSPEDFSAYNAKLRKENELRNSKGKISMLKFFKKSESKTEITNDADITDDSIVSFEGIEMTVKDFREKMNAKKNADCDMDDEAMNKKKGKKNKKNADEDGEDADEDVDLDDNKMEPKNKKSKKNADEDEDDKDKKNSKSDSKPSDEKTVTMTEEELQVKINNAVIKGIENANKDKDDKKKNFDELKNANKKAAPAIDMGGIARGNERYGSGK